MALPLSADVDIRLEVGDVVYRVGQAGGGFLVLRDDRELTPGVNARLVITVDGEEFPYDICICSINGSEVSYF